jgi:hypothetical protein
MEVAEILKAVHDIFDDGNVTVTVDERNLGMAYAIPRGSEATVVETFSPWTRAEHPQVFFRESALGAPMVEAQLIVSWRFSAARQYIIEAFVDCNVIHLDSTASLQIRVRFNNPSLFDTVLEAFEIPFQVEVTFKPLLGTEMHVMRGIIRADGTSEFNP